MTSVKKSNVTIINNTNNTGGCGSGSCRSEQCEGNLGEGLTKQGTAKLVAGALTGKDCLVQSGIKDMMAGSFLDKVAGGGKGCSPCGQGGDFNFNFGGGSGGCGLGGGGFGCGGSNFTASRTTISVG